MDPMTNPTSTSNSAPAPGGVPLVPVEPAPVVSAQNPAPVVSSAPVAQPAASAAPAVPTPPPVKPVINPNPVNPVFQPSGLNSVTEPESAVGSELALDSVEEKLKAVDPVPGSIGSAVSGPETTEPMSVDNNVFAATPAGSPQSVSFTDPATQPEMNTASAPTSVEPVKKKTSKTTLIALVIVAVIVVIALAVVLMMQLGVF